MSSVIFLLNTYWEKGILYQIGSKVTYNLHSVVGLIYLSYISVSVIECLFSGSDLPMLALVARIPWRL